MVVVSILSFDAIATMIFGSLGKTQESSGWNYVLTLYIFLGSLGIISTIANTQSKLKISLNFQSIPTVLSATLSFALLGFYYGGTMTDNNHQVATIAAITSGAIATILSLKQNQILGAATMPIATIAAYGFAFYAGTNAIALFAVSKLLGGIFWGIICLIYIGLTVVNFTFISRWL